MRGKVTGDRVFTLLVFVAAAAIRVWGVKWSLPYTIHPDESIFVDAGVRMIKTGDLDPQYYMYPSLVFYMQAAVFKLNLLWGTWQGYYGGPEWLPDRNQIFALAPELFLWGRTFTALIGAATVAAVYPLARSMFGRSGAIAAALLTLTARIHIESSHYITTDVPVAAFAVASVAAAWALVHKPTVRLAALSGVLVGLTTAAKYNGLYIVVVPATALLLAWYDRSGDGRRSDAGADQGARPALWSADSLQWLAGRALAMGAGALGAFLVTNPFALLKWDKWSAEFGRLTEVTLPNETFGAMVGSFFDQSGTLLSQETVPAVAGLVGAIALAAAALRTREKRLVWLAWLLIPYTLVYMAVMSRFERIFPRYLIICALVLCLLGGYAIGDVARVVSRWWSDRRAMQTQPRLTQLITRPATLALVLGLALGAEPARQMINFDMYLASPDTRLEAFSWLKGELRAGHRAAVELQPWLLCAPDPRACEVPDVYAPLRQLTEKPPEWYADRGYDYVMLLGKEKAVLEHIDVSGRRPAEDLAPYLSLPEVAHFAGDDEGGKGPSVYVYRTSPDWRASIEGVTHVGARYGDVAELWGYAMHPLASTDETFDPAETARRDEIYKPGGVLGLWLYFDAVRDGVQAGEGHNWTVSVHVTNAEGAVVAQVDVPPLSGHRPRPVREWYVNETVAGQYNIVLPPTLPPGRYAVKVIMYDAPNGPGLPATLPTGETVYQPEIGQITVE